MTYTKNDFLLQLLVLTPLTSQPVMTAAPGPATTTGFYWPLGMPGDFVRSATVTSPATWSVWTSTGYTAPVAGSTVTNGLDVLQDALGTFAAAGAPGSHPGTSYTMTDAESVWSAPGTNNVEYTIYYTTTYTIPTLPTPTIITVPASQTITVPITMVFAVTSAT